MTGGTSETLAPVEERGIIALKRNKMKDKIDALCETLYTLGKNSFKDNKEIPILFFIVFLRKIAKVKYYIFVYLVLFLIRYI